MTDVVTSIRIDADTKVAVAAFGSLDRAFETAAARSVPALRSSLTSLTSQMLASQAGFSGASGAVSILTTTLFAVNPVLGAAATAVSLLTFQIVQKHDAIKATTTVIDLNRTALSALAAENTSLGAKMEELRQKEIARITKQRDELKAWLDGQKEQSTTNQAAIPVWGALGGVMALFSKEQEKANAATGTSNALRNQVLATIGKLNDELKALNTTQSENAKITGKTAEELSKLNAANDDAVAAMISDSLKKQAENTQSLLDIETKRAQIRSQVASAGGDVFSIIEASNAAIAAETTAYETRLANANVFDGSRQVVEANHTLWLEGELAKRNQAVQQSLDKQAAANKRAAEIEKKAHKDKSGLIYNLGTKHFANILLLQHSSAREITKAVADETRAYLAVKALQWAAEAIAYAFTPGRQAEAAAKAKAAAMAGAGAIAISGIASAFEREQREPSITDIARQNIAADERSRAIANEEARLRGEPLPYSGATGGGGSSSQGRTLVSQGPVTLYYSSTVVVNGSILDKGDFFSLWNDANMENLRRAGYDAGTRAK